MGVADWVEAAGFPRPQVPYADIRGWLFGLTRDPTANEWADPRVDIPGWSKPFGGYAERGNVIAVFGGLSHGHVGVVDISGTIGNPGGLTISVNSNTRPAGIVTNNDWGFRPGSTAVVRIYNGQ